MKSYLIKMKPRVSRVTHVCEAWDWLRFVAFFKGYLVIFESPLLTARVRLTFVPKIVGHLTLSCRLKTDHVCAEKPFRYT